jgi:putative oxidoreductase
MRHDTAPRNLAISLLLLRLGVAAVMAFWTADKIVNPDHAGSVFANFYGLGDLGNSALAVIGVVQAIFVVAFAIGAFKTISYGAILLMHAVSTVSSWRQYLEPFENLLFFAAWPMLAGCVALFLLRDDDRLLAFDSLRARPQPSGD